MQQKRPLLVQQGPQHLQQLQQLQQFPCSASMLYSGKVGLCETYENVGINYGAI